MGVRWLHTVGLEDSTRLAPIAFVPAAVVVIAAAGVGAPLLAGRLGAEPREAARGALFGLLIALPHLHRGWRAPGRLPAVVRDQCLAWVAALVPGAYWGLVKPGQLANVLGVLVAAGSMGVVCGVGSVLLAVGAAAIWRMLRGRPIAVWIEDGGAPPDQAT